MTTTQLTPAQHAILACALDHTDGNIEWFPDNIKGGARKKVLEGLVNRALITPSGSDWLVADEGYDAMGRARPAPAPAPAPLPVDPEIDAAVTTAEAEWARTRRPTRCRPKQAEAAFNALYDQHKKSIHKLKEHRRATYEKLRLATAKPSEVPWHLPESIDFRRQPADPLWERHIYVEGNGQFRAELGNWEAAVLKEELADSKVVGWLRNVDRKPWSLEVPYESGGAVRPMFPDLVVVRQIGAECVIDILEPHDPSLADNFEKAVGLARFAEKHGSLFGRIQLIRKQSSAGGERFVRLEINQTAAIKKLLLITSNPQLDELFSNLAK